MMSYEPLWWIIGLAIGGTAIGIGIGELWYRAILRERGRPSSSKPSA